MPALGTGRKANSASAIHKSLLTIHSCARRCFPCHLAPETCPSAVQFDHVFIREEVIAVDHLALKFPVPPDARILELGEKIMVDMRRQVEHAGARALRCRARSIPVFFRGPWCRRGLPPATQKRAA